MEIGFGRNLESKSLTEQKGRINIEFINGDVWERVLYGGF
jgi:hypothetical protein